MVFTSSSTCRRIVAAGLMITLTACTTWRRTTVPTDQLLAERPPTVVRVTTVTGTQFVVTGPRLQGDTLVGLLPAVGTLARPVTVSLGEVRYIEVEQTHPGRTVAAAAGVTLLLVAAAAAAARSGEEERRPPPSSGDGLDFTSCPAIWSWDGTNWRLDSGTYSGAITAGLARAEVDNLEYAVPQDGRVRLRLATEPGETDYVDAVTVLAAEHAPGLRVLPDAAGHLHAVGALAPPVRVVDDRGRNSISQLLQRDAWYWESVPTGRDTADRADIRSGLDLTFVRPAGADRAYLVVDGVSSPWAARLNQELIAAHGTGTDAWYAQLDQQPLAAAVFQAARAREAYLAAAVLTPGGWVPQGWFSEAGPEVARQQVLPLDLSGVHGDTVVVRLSSAPNLWLVDYVGIDFPTEDRPFDVHELAPETALDQDGTDVRALLRAADRAYRVQETGEYVELSFEVPVPAAGRVQTLLVRTTGWYRIHSPNTGEPRTALLARLAGEEWGMSRLATARLNEVLATLR